MTNIKLIKRCYECFFLAVTKGPGSPRPPNRTIGFNHLQYSQKIVYSHISNVASTVYFHTRRMISSATIRVGKLKKYSTDIRSVLKCIVINNSRASFLDVLMPNNLVDNCEGSSLVSPAKLMITSTTPPTHHPTPPTSTHLPPT